ncbi:MAG: response regulator [Actinobacteria bacterium]|nr:response regulator [Actinomycetota bacterium]
MGDRAPRSRRGAQVGLPVSGGRTRARTGPLPLLRRGGSGPRCRSRGRCASRSSPSTGRDGRSIRNRGSLRRGRILVVRWVVRHRRRIRGRCCIPTTVCLVRRRESGRFCSRSGSGGGRWSRTTPSSSNRGAHLRRPDRCGGCGPERPVEGRGRAHLADIGALGAGDLRHLRLAALPWNACPARACGACDSNRSEDTVVNVGSTEVSDRPLVLLVEDDETVSEVVERYLEREGFRVEVVSDGADAVSRFDEKVDVIVLDIMLPSMDGLEVCRRLRSTSAVPIIMLTALGEESDRIMGLELGADDYLAKPFSPRELTARVKSVLRRAAGTLAPQVAQGELKAGAITLNLDAHEVAVAGDPIVLTSREFELLAWLMTHPKRVFTREELLERVWGYSYGDKSTVTVHVRRLREKIEADPAQPRHVATVWGLGYRFDP